MDGPVDVRARGAPRDMLRARWGRWTGIVEAFARRRPSRRRVDPAGYGALRRDLLADCRAAAEAAGPAGAAGLEDLESLVRPWLCPEALARADREILEGLLARCREIERRLGGRGPGAALRVAAARLARP